MSLPRRCGFATATRPNGDLIQCGADACTHFLGKNEQFYACADHLDEAKATGLWERFHRLGPDCGMPFARYDSELATCLVKSIRSQAA